MRRQLHLEVLHATRAAVRDTRGVDRRLLETVERDLLMPRPAVVSFRAALMEWEDCVAGASVRMDARSALTVARTQSALLSAGLGLMQRFEVTDGVGHERLQDAVQVASRSWGEAARIWRGLCPRGPAAMGRLERAMVQLQLAVSSSGDKERLDALLHTGFGGAVVAAMAVTPRGMHSGSDLVTSAVTLSVRSELAGGLLESQGPRGTAIDTAASRTPAPSRAMVIAGRTQTTPIVGQLIESGQPPQFGDAAQLAGLARTRDAGVVAGAARQGNAEATRLFAGASDSELAWLERAGVGARARIAESALPLVYAKSREVAPRHREEFVSLASLRLVEAAVRWDPHRARWSTYAYQVTERASREHYRNTAAASRETTGLITDATDQMTQADIDRTADGKEIAEAVTERDEHRRVLDLLRRLPDHLRQVAADHVGIGREPATLREIAAAQGVSATSASRRFEEAMDKLRLFLREGEVPASAPNLRALAQALAATAPAVTDADRIERQRRRAVQTMAPGR